MKDSQSQRACLFAGTLLAASLTATTPHAAAQDIPVEAHTVGGISSPQTVTAGDFNGDGNPDFASAPSANVVVSGFISNGGQPPTFDPTAFPNFFNENNLYWDTSALSSADLDGNGYDELIIGGWDSLDIGVSPLALSYYNVVTKSYEKVSLPGPASSDAQITDLAVADIDGDGDLDIVGTSRDPGGVGATANAVFWLENNTTGDVGSTGSFSFTHHNIANSIGSTMSVGVGDVDNNGTLDIVVGLQNGVQVFSGDTDSPPGFSISDPITDFTGHVHVALGDADGDGDDDIFFGTRVPGSSASGVTGWLRSNGGNPPTFVQQIISSTELFNINDVIAGDFDADGDIDFAGTTFQGQNLSQGIHWWDNDGDEDTAFTERVLYDWGFASNIFPHELIAEDLDGDGDLDFAVAQYNFDRIDWLENMTDPAPIITQQPLGQFVLPEAIVEFALEASGGATYQWSLNGKSLNDVNGVSGENSPTLSLITSPELEGVYSCVVSNPYASTTSTPVVLAVQVEGNNDSCVVDLNGDGVLDFFDISVFLQLFGMGCP